MVWRHLQRFNLTILASLLDYFILNFFIIESSVVFNICEIILIRILHQYIYFCTYVEMVDVSLSFRIPTNFFNKYHANGMTY